MEKVVVYHDKRKKNKIKTICVIWDGSMRYIGIGRCSKEDQFSRKIGRAIAVGRARFMKDKAVEATNNMFSFNPDIDMCPNVNIPKWMFLDKGQTEGGEIPF